MNNEIIEFLLFKLEQNYKCEKEDYFILYKPDIKDLLDYITNLQQENELNKEYSEFYKDMSDKWKDMSDVFKKSCKDYKSRIDKAIEYIEKQEDYFYNYPLICRENVLNILKGDSDV